jgi:hypothetical protein
MPFKKQILPEPLAQPACIYLRSKRMYVSGDFPSREQAEAEDACYCWCNQTQHVVGPDRQAVERRTCVSGRSCFRLSR